MHRRDFIKRTAFLATGTLNAFESENAESAVKEKGRAALSGIIDTNVSLARWPFRRLALDDTSKLAAKLRSAGIRSAWAGSFDGLLHKNISAVNENLVEECRRHGHGIFLPFGTVNPQVPDWEEDLRRCHEVHKMRGVRLFPNYHGYTLDHPKAGKLLMAAAARGLLVQLVVSVEDERVQHPLVRVPEVDVAALSGLLEQIPHSKIVLLNWFRSVKANVLTQLAATKQVWFDLATVEGVGGVANVLQQISAEQMVFGSHAPFFYFESALLKLRESPLTKGQCEMIKQANARRLTEA